MNKSSGNPLDYMRQAWLVIFLAILYGGGLAGIQVALSEKIAENKRNETISVIPQLVPGATTENISEQFIELPNGKMQKVYQANNAEGELQGWVIPAAGQGFADKIELLVGLSSDCSTITGMYIINQKETPGLGDFITGEEFRSQYVNKPADEPLVVVKTPTGAANEIQALTGATISTDAVTDTVNKTVELVRGPLCQTKEDSAS